MSENRPRGRQKNITGAGKEIQRKEEVNTSGPVGEKDAYASRKEGRQQTQQTRPQQSTQSRPQGSSLFGTPQQTQQTRPQQSAQNRPFGTSQQTQQTRPQQSAQNRPFGTSQQNQQARRQQSAQNRPFGTPQQTQQTRPQQNTQSRPQGSSLFGTSQQTQQSTQSGSQGSSLFGSVQQSSGTGKTGGGMGKLLLIVVAVLLLGGGGLSGLFGNLLGGSDGNTGTTDLNGISATQAAYVTAAPSTQNAGGNQSGSGLGGLFGGGTSSWYSLLGGGASTAQTGSRTDSTRLDTSVAPGSRDKYTALLGGGRDTVTLMVYMCGADLESRSGMATRDLQEMQNANLGSRVNLLIYTGGSTAWRNNLVSSSVNQIWQLKNGKFVCLEQNMGTDTMTSPVTLTTFIKYGAEHFPANRYQLILWDHGSGSVSGYGYDEKNSRSGSMSLAGIDTALKNGGLKFDFIGFDACLMATVENGLMLSRHADYLIASEETEPGIGWYYTDWLNALGSNTSISTLELGQKISDSFVSACASSCPGQAATLSVVDLAELESTVPSRLTAFSKSISGMIHEKEYNAVSNARSNTREFATSSRIDQVDLSDLALQLGTEEGESLAKAVQGAVKYNRSTLTNAYGLSIYFPYQKISNVDRAVSTYNQIGMDSDYAQCIRDFATMEASGQAATGGTNTQIPSILLGGSSAGTSGGGDLISSLLGSFLSGGYESVGLSDGTAGFLSGRTQTDEELKAYISDHWLDSSALTFRTQNGQRVLALSAAQWDLVHSVELNAFYDDGKGYIDLGLDELYDWDDSGNLIADTSGTWLAVNGQFCAYYVLDTQDDGETQIITGRIPVLINDWQAELIVVFTNGDARVAGARFIYPDGETQTVAKSLDRLETGDKVELIADCYGYDGSYQSTYRIGDPIIVGEEGLTVSDVYLPDAGRLTLTYRLTDIYNQEYWTDPV